MFTCVPLTATMTSPSRIPAFSAGPPLVVATTYRPWSTLSPYWDARTGVTPAAETPRYAAGASGSASAFAMVSFAESMAIANPMFCAWSSPAVLMPTTWPCMFTRGPPELPWLMAASVWMTSV